MIERFGGLKIKEIKKKIKLHFKDYYSISGKLQVGNKDFNK